MCPTRGVEHAHFEGLSPERSVVTHEIPETYVPGENEPYYPVLRPESHALFRRYAADAAELAGKVFFSGRLADFKYYDMDQAVSHALHAFVNKVAVHATEDVADRSSSDRPVRARAPGFCRAGAPNHTERSAMGRRQHQQGQGTLPLHRPVQRLPVN